MIAVLLLVATSLYAGFQWTIRVVVYPQLAAVPAASFASYEARHQRLVSYAVGPLFVADGVAALVAFAVEPGPPTAATGGCLAAVLALTVLGAVPQHRRLSDGFDPAAHRRLLRVDSARLVAALGGVAAAVWFAAGRL